MLSDNWEDVLYSLKPSLRVRLDSLVLFLKDNTLPATIYRAQNLYGSFDDFPELLTLLFAELLRVEEIDYHTDNAFR